MFEERWHKPVASRTYAARERASAGETECALMLFQKRGRERVVVLGATDKAEQKTATDDSK